MRTRAGARAHNRNSMRVVNEGLGDRLEPVRGEGEGAFANICVEEEEVWAGAGLGASTTEGMRDRLQERTATQPTEKQ